MSWFLAAIYNRFMAPSEAACLSRWRGELLGGLSGAVLEVGAGTGHNLAHYPASLERLVLTEPDPSMRARLLASARGRATVVGCPVEALPFDDASFDVVVSTLVLCSVVEPQRALAEIRRVLKPGGEFVFLEHVAADDRPGRLRWQQRLEPLWRRVGDNCHLTRRTAVAITDAGFSIERVERESMRKALPFLRPTVRGVARKSF